MAVHLLPRVLRYLDEVARLGSIQAASRELHISASAIDRQLLLLEQDLGVSLFERQAGGMRLTPAGGLVIALSRRWRSDLTGLWSNLKHMQGVDIGQVRLAAMDSHANGLLPSFIKRLSQDYPKVALEVDILNTDEAAAALTEGMADIAVAFNLKPHRDLHLMSSTELPLGCVLAPGHPLAQHSALSLKQIAGFPIAIQSRSLAIRRYLDSKHSWLFSQGEPPVVTNSLQLVKQLARNGAHLAITSELDTAPELLAGALVFIPISDAAAQSQTVSVAISARRSISRIARLVAEMLADEVRVTLDNVRAKRPADAG